MAPAPRKSAKKASAKKAAAPKTSAKKAAARKAPAAKKAPVKKASAKEAAAPRATMRRARAEKAGGEEAVLAYVEGLPAWQGAIARRLHALVKEAEPGVEPAVKWSMPVYSKGGLVCYVAPFSKHVGFGFYRGAEIPDLQGMEGSGKGNRHVKLRGPEDVDEARFKAWVRAAVGLNAAGPA